MFQNILVATDFSAAARSALDCGRALAQAYGARLHLLHVVEHGFVGPFVADSRALEQAAWERLKVNLSGDGEGPRACAVVRASHRPAEAIVSYAATANIDLIVTGTHGRGGAARVLMGSIAERVVRTAPCPVLIVRHPQREFVVSDLDANVRRVCASS